MVSDKIHTHKRKNSHLFNEQSTSGSSIRTDYDISMDNLEMENMVPPPIGRTTSIPSVPMVSTSRIDLENQDHTLGNPESSESWDDWYLTKKFGQNKRLRTTIYSILGILIAYIIVLLIISLSSSKGSNNGNSSGSHKPNIQQNGIKRDKSFDIEDVMKGNFMIDKKNFHFIEPPYTFESHDMDPGLYMTTITNNDGTRFLAKQLFDEMFEKDLGSNKFEYQEHEYVVDTIKVNFALDRLIFATEKIADFRHSSTANYWIKDVTTGIIKPISPYFDSEQPVRLSYAYFSPAYNFIYFVMDNNLYFQDISAEHAPVKVTSDGSQDIMNAKTDWVYEEEVLADDKAIWWAPDDSKFIFAKFNDTDVDSYTFPRYTTNQQYPPLSEIRYPTPSRANPTVELFFYNIGGNTIYNVNMDQKSMKEIILYDAQWLGPKNFLFKITDRFSKKLFVKVFNTDKEELLNTREYNTEEFNGWVEKTKNIFVVPPSEKIKRIDYGYVDTHQDNDGYNHLFYYKSPFASEGQQLTKGEWEITGSGVVGYELETDTIYFTANCYNPMSQNLFAVRLEGDPINELVTLQNPSEKHSFYDYQISSSSRYAVMEYLGPSLPFYAAGTLTNLFSLEDAKNHDVLVLSNEVRREDITNNYNLPITTFKSMTLDDGVSVDYIEIKPATMNVKRKYPLLINVYGGPGSQTFTAKSGISLEQAVVSSLDAIVLQIEPRGTGGKGWKFRSWASGALGYWEPRDITEVTKKFINENAPHINEENVAIWGWSYGGFSTLKTVEFDKGETFKYAIAVAPVTNWLYYDSIYTERYMGNVDANIEKYIEISRLNDVSSFNNMKRFLLLHGTADDNVHIQNTYEFTDRLNIAGIRNYDMHIFPDSDHSIRYHNAQNIIYKKLYYWIEEAFNGLLEKVNH